LSLKSRKSTYANFSVVVCVQWDGRFSTDGTVFDHGLRIPEVGGFIADFFATIARRQVYSTGGSLKTVRSEFMLRRTRLLFVGDSVTAGYGLVPSSAYPQLVAARLADRGLDVEVVVDALDGADSAYVLKRFDRMVTSHDPDWVVVALGLNDARLPRVAPSQIGVTEPRPARAPADFTANILAIIDRLLAIGARPVLMIPTPRFDAPRLDATNNPADRGSLMAPYVAALRDLAVQLRLPVIDVYQALLAEPELADMIPDGVHAGADGHQVIADVVTEELLPLLDPSRSGSEASESPATKSPSIGRPSSNRAASR
jgi:acyl-CoA thioesterase-1